MRVNLENSTPDFSRAAGPAAIPPINTQRAVTTLLVNDGETTVIGGIYTSNQQTVERSHARAQPDPDSQLAVQARTRRRSEHRAADLHYSAHHQGVTVMTRMRHVVQTRCGSGRGRRRRVSCGDVVRSGRSPVYPRHRLAAGCARRRRRRQLRATRCSPTCSPNARLPAPCTPASPCATFFSDLGQRRSESCPRTSRNAVARRRRTTR